jgi:hypothetical protein
MPAENRGFGAREGWQQGPAVPLPPNPSGAPPAQVSPPAPAAPQAPPAPPPPVAGPPTSRPPVPVTPRRSHKPIEITGPPSLLGPEGELPTDPTSLLQLLVSEVMRTNQLLTQQMQEGVVTPLTIVLTSNQPVPFYFNPPLFNLSLTNDGGSDIQYQIPLGNRGVWVTLKSSEVITFNFIVPVVHAIGLRLATASGNATVRAVGFY